MVALSIDCCKGRDDVDFSIGQNIQANQRVDFYLNPNESHESELENFLATMSKGCLTNPSVFL